MGNFGGFYKGEKKKKKKGSIKTVPSVGLGSPTISMPEIISKKQKSY